MSMPKPNHHQTLPLGSPLTSIQEDKEKDKGLQRKQGFLQRLHPVHPGVTDGKQPPRTMGRCLQIPCVRLRPCCPDMPCISNAEDVLLSMGHLEGFSFSEARSFLQHLHRPFILAQIILLLNPLSQNTVSKHIFFSKDCQEKLIVIKENVLAEKSGSQNNLIKTAWGT